jgi:hypothetical protein
MKVLFLTIVNCCALALAALVFGSTIGKGVPHAACAAHSVECGHHYHVVVSFGTKVS